MHESDGKQFPKWDPNLGEILGIDNEYHTDKSRLEL